MPRPAAPPLAWRDIADLPFAAALRAHPGALAADEEYDSAHFDHVDFEDPDAAGSLFLDCAFTRVSFQNGQLRQARFTQAWLRDVRLVGTGLAGTTWVDAAFLNGAVAGVEAFGSRLRRVVIRGCKLDSVNFRDTLLTDVTFEACVLRDVDFSGSTLVRTAFPDCRLSGVTFTRMSLDTVDLRGAELGLTTDPDSLRGAIVTSAQLVDMMPMLAESMGIMVDDG